MKTSMAVSSMGISWVYSIRNGLTEIPIGSEWRWFHLERKIRLDESIFIAAAKENPSQGFSSNGIFLQKRQTLVWRWNQF